MEKLQKRTLIKRVRMAQLQEIYNYIARHQPVSANAVMRHFFGSTALTDAVLVTMDNAGLMLCEDDGKLSVYDGG